MDDQTSIEVRALRAGLPGVHSWFSLAEEEQAVAGVRRVILGGLYRQVAELRDELLADGPLAPGSEHRDAVILDDVLNLIRRMDL